MATKKYVFCSSVYDNTDLYSLTLLPNGKTFDIKICKTITDVVPCEASNILQPKSVELFDYSDELYFKLFDQTYSTALLYMLDPYYRLKYANTKVYETLYFSATACRRAG